MNDLGLYQENQRLRAEIRKLQCENSMLRGLTGRRKRLSVKQKLIKLLDENPKMSSTEAAKAVKCTVRYVNQLKKDLFSV